MSGDDNMGEKEITSAQIETNKAQPYEIEANATALFEGGKDEIALVTKEASRENKQMMKQDGIHSSWFSTLKQRVGEFTETLPKSINWKNVGTVGLAGIMLYQAACNAKPVNADTQPTANATQTLAAQAEESQEIPETPENIEEVPEENIYPTPTVEVEQREHPKVDLSFTLTDFYGSEVPLTFTEKGSFYYGIAMGTEANSFTSMGGYYSSFGGEDLIRNLSRNVSQIAKAVPEKDRSLFAKYLTCMNGDDQYIDSEGHFSSRVLVLEYKKNMRSDSNNNVEVSDGNSNQNINETLENDNQGEEEREVAMFLVNGGVVIERDGIATPYPQDKIPWDNLPFEAWDLIGDYYTKIVISSDGEIYGDWNLKDYIPNRFANENPAESES